MEKKISLKYALKKFDEKNYNESKNLLSAIVEKDPNNFDALHSLGVVCGVMNNHAEAIKYLNEAVKIKPNNISANFNLANALLSVGNYEDSLFFHKRALKIEPQNTKIIMNYAKALFSLKRYKDSFKLYISAAQLNPNSSDVWFNLGSVCLMDKKYKESIKYFNNAIKFNKNNSDAWSSKGRSHLLLKNHDEALECFSESLKLNNKNKDIIYNYMSMTYIDKNENKLNADYTKAVYFADLALKFNAQNVKALNSLALCKIYNKDLKEAIILLNKAKDLDPNYYLTFVNLGLANKYLGNFINSENFFLIAKKLKIDLFEHHISLGEAQLSQNNFIKGWDNLEYRKKKIKNDSFLSRPFWNPSLGNKKILIWGEQGIGDIILFSTILNDVLNTFEKVILLIDDKLVKLFKENFDRITIYGWSDKIKIEDFDYHLSICSLGKYFRKEISDFKKNKFRLNIQDNFLFKKKTNNFKCGLSWGSTHPDVGSSKSIELKLLEPILKIKEIDFYNIQYTNTQLELEQNNKDLNRYIYPMNNIDKYNDIYTLLQFIKSCDFIITVSNTNAHLAAAIGKPTFLLLSKGVGRLWYWNNNEKEKNLWYPTIRFFNQEHPGDWNQPIKNLKKFLLNNWINKDPTQ